MLTAVTSHLTQFVQREIFRKLTFIGGLKRLLKSQAKPSQTRQVPRRKVVSRCRQMLAREALVLPPQGGHDAAVQQSLPDRGSV